MTAAPGSAPGSPAPGPPPQEPWILPAALGAVLVLAFVGIVAVSVNAGFGGGREPVRVTAPGTCTVTAPPDSPGLQDVWTGSAEQADSAATIAAIGRSRGAPDRAVTIAIATAIQESSLENIDYGDRDSVGLFQQRPSQGWGEVEEILDPVYSTNAFYDALLELPTWQEMSVTDAAQEVQRSAFPRAYADHEDEARTLAVAFLGQRPGAVVCAGLDPSVAPVDDVADLADDELGDDRVSGEHSATDGWAIASWLVAHSARLALDRVTFDGVTWTAESGVWAPTGPPDGLLSFQR